MLSSAGNSNNNLSNYASSNSTNLLSAEEMFRKISSGNGKIVDANFSKKSGNDKNWTVISPDKENTSTTEQIIKDDNKVSYLYQKNKDDDEELTIAYGQNSDDEDYNPIADRKASVTTSFGALAAAVGANGNKITKEQLATYLQSLTSDAASAAENTTEITFLKNLIAKFSSLSDGSDYITSLQGVNDAQDYSTVTPEQVTSPIDIRV